MSKTSGTSTIQATASDVIMNGCQIAPGVFLIGEPSPRPDLGEDKYACLANMDGMLVVLELTIKPAEKNNESPI